MKRILNEFKNSNIKIKSSIKLKEYIDFCISNNEKNHTSFSTEHHHILPKAKDCFPEFLNLKIHTWNGSYLSYENHFIAHSLLAEAVDNKSVQYSFIMLSNMSENTDTELYALLKKKASTNHSKFQMEVGEDGLTNAKRAGLKISKTRNSREWKEGAGLKAIERQKETKLSQEWKERVGNEAIRKTKEMNSEIEENGNTKARNTALKAAKTCRTIIDDNGLSIKENMIINFKEAMRPKQAITSKKMAISRSKVDDNGLSSFDKGAKKGGETKREKGRHFVLFDGEDKIVEANICLRDLGKLHSSLKNSSKENPIGSTKRSNMALKKFNKEYLKGYYSKEII